jgi:D-alanyl-D-alanine carboxypeptidase
VSDSIFKTLGIPADYGAKTCMPRFLEPPTLVDVGPNIVGRTQKLVPEAANAWDQMKQQAHDDGVTLLLVSGFRSIAYQAELIKKKLAKGQSIDEILCVNAAPGYSQHHSGCALDLATTGCRPLTEDFEATEAFEWLTANAGSFNFCMPYDRTNSWGIAYEPWHWFFIQEDTV